MCNVNNLYARQQSNSDYNKLYIDKGRQGRTEKKTNYVFYLVNLI